MPGRLSGIFGITVEEYSGLPDGEAVEMKTTGTELGGQNVYTCRNWAEMPLPTIRQESTRISQL